MLRTRSRTEMSKTPFDYCDVLIAPDPEGWVLTVCNPEARRAIERIFLDLPIKWDAAGLDDYTPPGDWRLADLNVQAMVEQSEDPSRMLKIAEGYEADGTPMKITPQSWGLAFGLAILNQDETLRVMLVEEDGRGRPIFRPLRLTADEQ